MRSRSESNTGTECPKCKGEAKRLLSGFSHYSASAPDSQVVRKDGHDQKMWESKRKAADNKLKNPDPLKPWREERCKTLGYGPEKWTDWAKEENTKKQKKKDYGDNWLGREA